MSLNGEPIIKLTIKQKKWIENFKEGIQGVLREYISHADESSFYQYVVMTGAGALNLTIYDNWIACRFVDLDAAKHVLGDRINQYSGKWNHHYSFNNDVVSCIDNFRYEMNKIKTTEVKKLHVYTFEGRGMTAKQIVESLWNRFCIAVEDKKFDRAYDLAVSHFSWEDQAKQDEID